MFAQLAVMATLFELAVGYPQGVYRAIGHPVTWIGGLIAQLDAKLNRPEMTYRRRRLAVAGASECSDGRRPYRQIPLNSAFNGARRPQSRTSKKSREMSLENSSSSH